MLLRTIISDNPQQAKAAQNLLQQATLIAVTLSCLCELAWVLGRVYRLPSTDVASAIRALLEVRVIVTDRRAVHAGLALLDAGGDFADGIIAHEGRWLGGETFVSFDRKAVKLLQGQNKSAQVLA